MKNTSEFLRDIIVAIQTRAQFDGKTVTEEEISGRLRISIQQFERYISGDDAIPLDLMPSLIHLYGVYLKPIKDSIVKEIRIPDDIDIKKKKS